jgi:hypothetical protein
MLRIRHDTLQTRRAGAETSMRNEYVSRFLGGPPLAVLGRLILLSIVVGVILHALGLDPWNILASVQVLLHQVWDMGFDVVRWLGRYFLLGAVIVVPIWLITRVAKAPKERV